jgi:fatty-acyl-CoA synthase
MMEDPEFEDADFSGIRRIRCGAAPASLEMMKAYWKKGELFCNGYGMTETGPGVLSMPINAMTVEQLEEKRLSVGRPMIYVHLRIVDEEGNDVKRGEKGELLIRSAALFSGYWNNPEETANVLKDGWMHSGDIAMQDEDGYYYIVGRKKNMFISHGENIYPVEIENVLLECRGIREVCVIGVEDKRRGEVGKAIVVLEENAKLTKEQIFDYIGNNLPKIKQPQYVEIVDELPRNSVGKIMLPVLREKYGRSE